MAAATISVDEFMALEQKVLQTVELIKKEREARATAEAEAKQLREQLHAANEKLAAAGAAQSELDGLHRERDAVRKRIEKMVATMDGLL